MEKKAVIIDYLYSTWAPLRRNLHGKGYEVTHFDTLKEFISTRTFAGLGLGKPKPMLEISLAYSECQLERWD